MTDKSMAVQAATCEVTNAAMLAAGVARPRQSRNLKWQKRSKRLPRCG